MPLSLDQYASYLDTRDLPWPVAPDADPPRAKPHAKPVSGVRAVLWTVYGTLLRISEGDLKFEVANDYIMEVALEKTIHEFKMWNSMSRKPGQPSAYMREIYQKGLAELRLAPSGGEKYPEILTERIWENIIKKLFQKDYKFDATMYGGLNEFSRKVAYFFHASLQGTACYEGAAAAMSQIAAAGLAQGLLADGQCFTTVQLSRGLKQQDANAELDKLIPAGSRWLSFDKKARKPSDSLMRTALRKLEDDGITADEILHVGSSLTRDIAPARKLGMKTALFAGDRQSLAATAEQLKDPLLRPDVMLTELDQIAHVIG